MAAARTRSRLVVGEAPRPSHGCRAGGLRAEVREGGDGGRPLGAAVTGAGAGRSPLRRGEGASGRRVEGRRALRGSVSAAPSALPLPSPGHEYVTPLYFPSSIAEAPARHIVLLGLRRLRRRERATGARRAVSAGRGLGPPPGLPRPPPGLSP